MEKLRQRALSESAEGRKTVLEPYKLNRPPLISRGMVAAGAPRKHVKCTCQSERASQQALAKYKFGLEQYKKTTNRVTV